MYLIDWLSVVIPVTYPRELSLDHTQKILHELGWSFPLSESTGRYHYEHGFRSRSLNIYFSSYKPKEAQDCLNRGILLEFSGQACRELEEYFVDDDNLEEQWLTFLLKLKGFRARFTRLDLARDMKEKPLLDRQLIEYHLLNGLYKAKFRNKGDSLSKLENFSKSGHIRGFTYYLGSRRGSSKQFIRYYDKSAELDLELEEGRIPFWERLEIVLRKEKANEAIEWLFSGITICELYQGLLADYIMFLEEDGSPCSWWEKFIKNSKGIKLGTTKNKPNIIKTINWIDKSVLGTLKALSEVSNELGVDLYQIISKAPVRLSRGYENIITEWNMISDEKKEMVKKRLEDLKEKDF